MNDYLPIVDYTPCKMPCQSKSIHPYARIMLLATHGYTWLKAWRAIGCPAFFGG